jgi:hypothetical protein
MRNYVNEDYVPAPIDRDERIQEAYNKKQLVDIIEGDEEERAQEDPFADVR